MENMLIRTPQGNYPLSTVADMTMGRSLSMINGYNGQRVIRVDAFMKDERASITPIMNEVENDILPKILENIRRSPIRTWAKKRTPRSRFKAWLNTLDWLC